MNIKFILGSKDPEMLSIEKILKKIGYEYEYAMKNGYLCNPTNSYECDNVIDKNSYNIIIFIECEHMNTIENCIFIDHHRIGDYGYALDYRNFLEASSIGQLYKYILTNDVKAIGKLDLKTEIIKCESNYFYYLDNNWYLNVKNFSVRIPEEIVLTAAIDHCLSDAYNDMCKGVSKNEIFDRQMKDIMQKYSISKYELAKLSEFYLSYIKEDQEEIIDLTHLDLGIGYSLQYILLREVSLFNDKSIAVKSKNEHSNEDKLMLLGLKKCQVDSFLKKKRFSNLKLENHFGVPTRGYAGAIIKRH